MAKLMAGTNYTDTNTHTHTHRTIRPTGTSATQSTQNRTVIKTSTPPNLGATALGQFVLTSNQATIARELGLKTTPH